MEKRKLILRNFLSPGDLVMLTAAVRDLHRAHPGRFITDVRTSCPELWEHNPFITPLREGDPGVEQIDCHYPLIHRSNTAPFHFVHGFAQFLGEELRAPFPPTTFAGDIHLSRSEQRWKSAVHELAGIDLPFWIVNAGGKFDFTTKWWDWRRFQRVVDHFRGRILFVQVGDIGHYHPQLEGVVDLRGKTGLRSLVRLVYHAQGVLCGVTALMHLAAAVPTRPDHAPARAAVIVAGGREPVHWEAYPHHQFIHTIGALPCCLDGGCWRARTVALGDGEEADAPEKLCADVRRELPRCMDMISAEEVVRRIETYFAGGARQWLARGERAAARRAIAASLRGPRFESTIHLGNFTNAMAEAVRAARTAKVPASRGRAVIMIDSGTGDADAPLRTATQLRRLSPEIPIECWLAAAPRRATRHALEKLQVPVRCAPHPNAGALTPAELRVHALVNTRFREVLVVDADAAFNGAPEKLFSLPAFRRAGVLFAPGKRFQARPGAWRLLRLATPRRSAACAALLIDRARCGAALHLWGWLVARSYFFRPYVDGDGGAAQLAFARLGLRTPLSQALAGSATP